VLPNALHIQNPVHAGAWPVIPPRYAHAWIETDDGRVYDPPDHAYYPITDWYARKRAVAVFRYHRRDLFANDP